MHFTPAACVFQIVLLNSGDSSSSRRMGMDSLGCAKYSNIKSTYKARSPREAFTTSKASPKDGSSETITPDPIMPLGSFPCLNS